MKTPCDGLAMRVYSPGKINLHLRVGPVRPDGFHPLHSWMVTVGLFDNLEFHYTPGRLALNGGDHLGPVEDNLVFRAAKALRAATGRLSLGAEMRIDKSIPVGGGMGGGSGNAAATLTALNRLWELNLPDSTLMSLAAGLGSDVPFFLAGHSAWCRGRGEIIEPALSPRPKWTVLILPPVHASTPAVYRQFDAAPAPGDWDASVQPADWAALPAVELLKRLRNDLEPPADTLYVGLATFRNKAASILGRPVRMSGSGSTHFSVFDEEIQAWDAADALAKELDWPGTPLHPGSRVFDTSDVPARAYVRLRVVALDARNATSHRGFSRPAYLW